MRWRILCLAAILCFSVVSAAQEDICPSIVQQALTAVSDNCLGTGRNQACYGNVRISATVAEGARDFVFDQQGDVVNVADLQALRLSGMAAPDEWGVALLSLQANLPDTLPGQNVTVLLFGDVQLENAGTPPPVTLDVTVSSNINVRSGPGTSNSVLRGLSSGATVTAEGRNNAGDWVRIQLPDGSGTGWVSAPLVTIDGDVMALAVVDASVTDAAGATYGPMQAFTFRSGVGASQCAEAPQDGLLIQTPQGAGTVELLVNEVAISLGSTAYLQAVPGDVMTISMLEGLALVTASGVSVYAPAGTVVIIPLDANGVVSGAPVIQAYSAEQVASLPITLLPTPITAAPPTDPATVDTPPDVTGIWRLEAFVFVNCPSGDAFLFDVEYGFVLENRVGGFAVLETLAGRGGPTPGVAENPRIWEYAGGGEFVDPNGFAVTMLSATQGLSVSMLDLSRVTSNSCTNTIEIPFYWARS